MELIKQPDVTIKEYYRYMPPKQFISRQHYYYVWKSGNKVIPRRHKSQQNHMKIADSVWLSLYTRDNEYVQHPSRPLALASAGINGPKGPEKYINTEVKYGATFYFLLCFIYMNQNQKWSLVKITWIVKKLPEMGQLVNLTSI
jgi:hypothetical protein